MEVGRREEGGTRRDTACQVLAAWLLTGGRSVDDWQDPSATDWRRELVPRPAPPFAAALHLAPGTPGGGAA